MKIFKNINIPNNYKNSAIAIGNFDGVHKGHQKVFYETKKFAKKNKLKFGVLTFVPLPVMFFNKNIKNYRLASEDEKLKLFKKNKVDFTINVNFNRKFSNISAEDFISKIIYKNMKPRLLAVSKNFKFGKGRKGDIRLLKRLSNYYNYKLLRVKALNHTKRMISSSKIRNHLKHGNINLANKLLSRTWFIEGKVIEGKKLGRKLGYRTCNIHVKNYILPKEGIYAVKVSIGNKKKMYAAVAYFGSRPTFKGKKIYLEINIFGINKNLYKKKNESLFFEIFKR